MSPTTPLQSISLAYREGSSDKVYHVQLCETAGGFVVNFQYGRRGSSLQSGTKTTSPVSRAQAEKVYSKLVAEKKAKGYTEGESGAPYSDPIVKQEPSGYLPQLANPVSEEEIPALIADDNWCLQEKIDGVRQILIRSGKQVTAANRKGLLVPVSDRIANAILSMNPFGEVDFVLDGEAVGDVYVPFDVLSFKRDLRMAVAKTRLGVLDTLFAFPVPGVIRRIRAAYTKEEKQALYEDLKAKGAEGVIFKRLDASYVPGRPASGGVLLKFKFQATVTCSVVEINTRRSVRLAVRQARATELVSIGNVTIPPNHAIPQVGQMVEIRYLYAFPGGSLYQPIYLGVRNDLDIPDDVANLKLKSIEADSDDE